MHMRDVIAELERHNYECEPMLIGGIFLYFGGEPIGFLSEQDVTWMIGENRPPRKVVSAHRNIILRIFVEPS